MCAASPANLPKDSKLRFVSMSRRPTVLLLIPHLGGGGAEHITSLLARGLSAQKYDVHLGLVTQNEPVNESLPPSVIVHNLGAHRVRTAVLELLRLIRKLKPDLILSGMAHLNFLVLLLRPLFPRKTHVLVRQTNGTSAKFKSGHWPDGSGLLYRLLYPHADLVLCQTRAMAEDLARQTGLGEAHLRILPNPVDVDAIHAHESDRSTPFAGPGPHLLAVGRLAHEKGFDLLIRAFSSLRLRYPEADLTIVGEGSERAELESISRALQLGACVHLVGHVPHPEAYFPGATLFVLSSRHEGLPNALLEAASAGLPIAALPAEGGVADLLRSKPGVWLASEVSQKGMAHALLLALHALGPSDRFPHQWVDEFRMDRAIRRYESVIDEVLGDANVSRPSRLRSAQ